MTFTNTKCICELSFLELLYFTFKSYFSDKKPNALEWGKNREPTRWTEIFNSRALGNLEKNEGKKAFTPNLFKRNRTDWENNIIIIMIVIQYKNHNQTTNV